MKNGIFIFVMLLFVLGCENIPTPKGSGTSGSNVEESKKRGNRITSALAAYRADHLAFPANLSLLVPKYIPKIESPLSGPWLYRTLENTQRYNLGFKMATGTECWFDSQQNYWDCDGK